MSIQEPIQPSIQLQLYTEKLNRTIEDCQDIETIRQIAKELLNLHQKKSAIAQWATRRAVEAEKRAMDAEMNKLKQ